jgi:hypothetical protein
LWEVIAPDSSACAEAAPGTRSPLTASFSSLPQVSRRDKIFIEQIPPTPYTPSRGDETDAHALLKKTAHIKAFGPKLSMADVIADLRQKSASLHAAEANPVDAEALLRPAET